MKNHNPFRYFKISPEIIRLAVMMYVRFPLSLRNVEDLLHERGIDICHETVRYWWNRFGPLFAREIRKKRLHPSSRNHSSWKCQRDEVFVKINGETYYLWRAVDHEGEVLEAFVSKRRDCKTAMVFLKKIMKRYGKPRVIVTDRLRSYRAAMNLIGNESSQETGRWKNNRCENSHLPFRRREQAMQKFRRLRSLQKFVSIHSSVHNHFNHERLLTSREEVKLQRDAALVEWQQLSAA
ncbi:IS6 family transposase [Sneathiella litorea]|uniref:IS6 family transposase n=1 Tax=Sneathiella litorea TaxID=2606216 RepID=A0A6L8W8B9_9PROT|nr:IS6 family transposase [Sneathiella litorea]MZR30744.1 IS6 family transposase [Sneathiella litorea]